MSLGKMKKRKNSQFVDKRVNRYSIRKMKFGAASVMVGSFLFLGFSGDIKAAETDVVDENAVVDEIGGVDTSTSEEEIEQAEENTDEIEAAEETTPVDETETTEVEVAPVEEKEEVNQATEEENRQYELEQQLQNEKNSAKSQINQLGYLEDATRSNFLNQIDQANDSSAVSTIVNNATAENDRLYQLELAEEQRAAEEAAAQEAAEQAAEEEATSEETTEEVVEETESEETTKEDAEEEATSEETTEEGSEEAESEETTEEVAEKEAESEDTTEEDVEEEAIAEETIEEDAEQEAESEETTEEDIEEEAKTEKATEEKAKVTTEKSVKEQAKPKVATKKTVKEEVKPDINTEEVAKSETEVVESINTEVTEAYTQANSKEELSESLSKVVEQTFTAKDTERFMKTLDSNIEELSPEEFTYLIYKQLSDNKDESSVVATREKDEVDTEEVSEEKLSLSQKRSFSIFALDVNLLNADVNALIDEKTIINVDAIESGKIESGGDFQTTPGIVSGWLDVATDNYSPGINGSQTALNGYKVFLQWIDKDGTVSPVYEATTHDLGGTRAGQAGDGVYAFDIGAGWTDATGKLHKPDFQSVSSQKFKMWLAPGQESANGNEYFTYRKQPGNSIGFSGAVVPTGEFILAGHSMQRTAIYVYEKPSNVTMTTPESEWKYDEEGPDSNPSYLPDGVNKKEPYAVSGQVWWETSTAGTTYPTSSGEEFINQTLEEARDGFRVVTSVLSAEGIEAFSSIDRNIEDVNERIRAQQELLAGHPEYIQQTVVAPIVGERGRYTARFDERFDSRYMYQYVIDEDGEVVPGYTAYTSPVFTSPSDYADSTPFISANRSYVYNSHFALVADPSEYEIDITNFDAVDNIAHPGDTAVSEVISMYYPGETTEIVWLDTSGDSPVELSRTAVNSEVEAENAAQFTVPTDITERKTYTVQLVVNGNIIAADSFAADYVAPPHNEVYEPVSTPIEKEYGQATTSEEVISAVTVPNFPTEGEQPVFTVNDPSQLPDGNTPGNYTVDVTVTYPDGTTDVVQVPVNVGEMPWTPINPAPTVDPIDDQTVNEETPINPIVINAEDDGEVTIEVSELPEGVTFDPETNTISGTPVVDDWGQTEEERTTTVTVTATDEDGATTTEEFDITVQRDTDGDGDPDVTDPDDDNDGYTDEEEEEAGSDPKDPDSFPATPINPAPTVDAIDDQTVNEETPINPIVINAEDDGEVTIEVSELPEGVTFDPETNTISGTPVVDDWGQTEEERTTTVTVTATDEDGATTTEEFDITVQRDTDGDGDPDVTDPDDDNDGYTDEEEEEAGSDPKDDGSIPATPINPAPTVDAIDDQTVNEGTPINPIVINAEDDGEVTIEVSELPEGVTFDPETNTISGTPTVDDWGPTEETREYPVTVTVTDEDGATVTEEFIITVQRDTDGDGDPDITDPDDDNDGYTDEEEEEAGSDPKDDGSIPATPINPAPTVDAIDDQTVNEGTPIETITINAEDDGDVTVEVSELPEGVTFNRDTNEISGTPTVEDWGPTEETREYPVTVTVTDEDGATVTEEFIITVQRDTDGDGDPDVTDPDDDNDGYTDEEEEEAGSDPKDPDSFPATPINPAPTVDAIDDQTVNEETPINPIVINAEDDGDVTIEVSELPEGVTFDPDTNTISGTPVVDDWGQTEEERTTTVTVTVTDEDGAKVTEEFVITVQRDTDGDGDPDVTDPDDDNDGFTDEEEEDAGTDPKDPNSYPEDDDVDNGNPVITPIDDQTVNEGNPIEPIVIEVSEDADIEVDGLPEGVTFDPETNEISGTPEVEWTDDEEERSYEVIITATDEDGNTDTETVIITVQRDTDGDGDPDVTDPDDDNDGFTDEEEIDAGTDPKDPNSYPEDNGNPVITPIDDQEVNEGNPIDPIVIEVNEDADIEVDGLPDGVTFDPETNTISGTPEVEWTDDEEERSYEVIITATDEDGNTTTETVIITVQRDTDGDGDPDVTDPDDDNDGFTDEEEIDAGTDPKDPNSYPEDDDTDNGNPVITPIDDQEVNEGNPIDPIVIEVNEDADIEVDGLPDGVTFDPETNTISGTPEVEWEDDEEERSYEVIITATDKDGNTTTETVIITVQRDTDGDGDPDVTDPDDDNDGFTDEVEKDAGTDPKDPNSYPENEVHPTTPTDDDNNESIVDDSDDTTVDAPVINPVDVDDQTVSGTGTPGHEVTVTFPNGETVTTTVNADGTWTVNIPGSVNLEVGQVITAVSTDENGNVSQTSQITVTDNDQSAATTNTADQSDNGGDGSKVESLPDTGIANDGKTGIFAAFLAALGTIFAFRRRKDEEEEK